VNRLVGRGVVFIWVLVYWITIHPILLIPVFGVFAVAVVTFFAASLWGVIFYLLLRSDEDLEKVKGLLKRLRGKNGGIRGRVLGHIPRFEDEPVLPLYWILVGFVIFGAVGGVPIVKLTYPEERLHRVLLVILGGCALNVVVWVILVYGPPLLAVRQLVLALFNS